VETPPSPIGRAIAVTIVTLFCAALTWASLSSVDIVSLARGKLVPSGRVKVVQPLEIGVVRDIRVHDGQRVRAGEVLIELDPTLNKADVEHIRNDLMAQRLEIARLRAALSGIADPMTAFDPPTGAPPALVAVAKRHLSDQVAEQRHKLAALDRQRAAKEAERASAQSTIEKFEATIPVLTRLLRVYETLYKDGNGTQVQYLQTLEKLLDQQHELEVQKNRYRQADAAVAAVVENFDEAEAEYRSDLSARLTEAETKAAGFSQDLVKATERAKLQVLRAPIDGVVQQLSVHTVGGVVTPAQPLLVVVPVESQLEIEATIPNRDIGFVRAGQKAKVKVDAFNYTKYGLIDGKVISVSSDSIIRTRSQEKANAESTATARDSSEPPNEQLVYNARITLDRTQMLIDGKAVSLRPGMAVTAEINTGSRRIIDYLLSPLRRYGHESLHER
jgi:hemolysin D